MSWAPGAAGRDAAAVQRGAGLARPERNGPRDGAAGGRAGGAAGPFEVSGREARGSSAASIGEYWWGRVSIGGGGGGGGWGEISGKMSGIPQGLSARCFPQGTFLRK